MQRKLGVASPLYSKHEMALRLLYFVRMRIWGGVGEVSKPVCLGIRDYTCTEGFAEWGSKCNCCLKACLHKPELASRWLFIRDPQKSSKVCPKPRCCNCCLSKQNCFLSKHFKAPGARLISLKVGGWWEWWMRDRIRLMACRHWAFI